MARHKWPGNVRELENVLRSLALFCEGAVITSSDLVTHHACFAELATQRRSLPPAAPTLLAASALADDSTRDVVPSDGEDDDDDDGPMSAPPESALLSTAGDPSRATEAAYAHVRGGKASLFDLKRQIERDCILLALKETGGNITRAASSSRHETAATLATREAVPTLVGGIVMIRGRSISSLFVVAACAAMLVGCAADAGDESPAPTDSSDALTNAPAAADEAPVAAADEAAKTAAKVDTGNSRLAAVHDTHAWAQGEPQPIPWHQQKVSADDDDDGTAPSDQGLGEGPFPPSPSDPAFHR